MFILQTTIFFSLQTWLVPVVINNTFLINSGAVWKNLNNCFKIPFSSSWTTLKTTILFNQYFTVVYIQQDHILVMMSK